MKKLCLAVFLMGLLACTAQAVNGPGWFEGAGERVPYGLSPGGDQQSKGGSGPMLLSGPDEETPAIQELARNLQHDPRLIYEFVRNKIEYVPYYGFLKGAEQTLLDRAGNDADQSALLVALLRGSGFSPEYNYGYQWIPTMAAHEYTAARWFDLEDSRDAVDRTIYDNGIPGIAYSDWTIIDRIWVKLTITGQVYQLDAAFKPHTRPAGIDLASAMNYDRAGLLAAAGGEIGNYYVRNLNETNLARALATLSSNLVASFRTGYPNAETDEILGKSAIIPIEVSSLPTSLPFTTYIIESWTTPPTNLIHTVRIRHGEIDETFNIAEIAGKRLSITYTNGSGMGSLSALSLPGEADTTKAPRLSDTAALSVQPPPNWASNRDMVIQMRVPGVAQKTGGGVVPLGTYSWDFGHFYSFAPYCSWTGSISPYSNPNPVTLHTHAWLENNNSGAFTIIGGGGYVDYGQWGVVTIRVRFNGCGQSYGLKTAKLRLSGWYYWPTLVFDDTWNMYGYVAQEPRISNSYGVDMGITWLNHAVTGSCRVVNNGYATLFLNNMYLVGPGAAQFGIIGPTSYQIPSGGYQDIPVRFKATSQGTHCATNHLSFYYDGIGYEWDYLPVIGTAVSPPLGQLWIDDSLVASESGVVTTEVENLILTINHPYAAYTNTYADQTMAFPLKRGAAYAIISDFGSCDAGRLLDSRQRKLEQYRRNGCADTSREVLTETLNVLGQTWMRETTLAEELMGRIGNVRRTYHHRYGIMAQEEGYYVDVKAQMSATIARDGDATKETTHFPASGFMASALEHGILEQLQGTNKPAASTVKLLGVANLAGAKIFLANSNNFAAIQPQLTNYTAPEIADFQARVNYGQVLVLPADAQITLLEWRGKGYVVHGPSADGYSEIAMIIGGDYYGAYGAAPGGVSVPATVNNYYRAELHPVEKGQVKVKDPVDIASGNFVYDREDLSIGSGVPPLGLSFRRFYNSGQINLKSVLGYGWHHNLDIRAQVRSEGAAGLGRRSPADAAALLVASVAIGDIMANETNAKGWASAALVSKWATDQLSENAVSVQIADQNMEFIRLPDGSFSPPPGITAALSKSNGLFRLTERYGVALDFNAQNRLATWKDADGNTMGLAYNAQTNLQTATDAFGRTLTFSYDGSGWLSGVQDSTGRRFDYWKTAQDDLEYAFDPDADWWWLTYAYNTNHQMTYILNELLELSVSNEFSATSGNVLSQRSGAGRLWNMYVVPQFRGVEEDPLGGKTTYFFDDRTRQVARIDALGNASYAVYDGQNHIILQEDARGSLAIHEYDANHNRTNTTDALGHETAFTYDSQNRLIKVKDALGYETTTGYDAEHHPILRRDALSNATVIAYYANGLPQTVTGPRGEVATYSYDAYGNPSSISRTDGGTETRTWNTRGDLLTLTDANTNTTTYTYDQQRRPTSERDARGCVISNVYNMAGLLITNIDQRGAVTLKTWTPTYKERSVRYPDGGVVSNVYDAADRLAGARSPRGFWTSNRYDAAGRLVAVSDPLGRVTSNAYDAVGNVILTRDALGSVISNRFDALNRPVSVRDALGYVTSNEYDAIGRRTATIDAAGKRAEYAYDALGRLIETRRPGGLVDRFGYDASGNRVAYTNPNNAVIRFGYDRMNRVAAETNALGLVRKYGYRPNGWRSSRTDMQGRTTQYGYDSAGRMTNVAYSDGTFSRFSYDNNANLLTASSAVAVVRCAYDSMNRLTQTVFSAASATSMIQYVYDIAGNRTTMLYPGGKASSYTYDPLDRTTNVQSGALGISGAKYVFDPVGNLTSVALPGGVNATFTPDAARRIAAYSCANAASNYVQRSITRNGLGFKTAENVTAGCLPQPASTRQHLQNNPADQVAHVSRLDSYRYPEPWKNVVPTYDADGNVTQMLSSLTGQVTKTVYRWNCDNRLVSASSGAAVVQFSYDALGSLVGVNNNGTNTLFVRDYADPLKRPLAQVNAQGNPLRYFVWANGRLLAQVETNGAVRYAQWDEQGNVIAYTDGSGSPTDQFAYEPYGKVVGRTGTGQYPFTWLGSYGVLSVGNDLYLTLHRAYDADLRRFLSADPIGIQGGLNFYIYGSDNPLAFLDPLGLCADSSYNGQSWGQGGSQNSSYNGQVLRAPPQYAQQQRWTDLSYGRYALTAADAQQAEITGGLIANALIASVGPAARSTTWNPLNGPGPLGEKVAGTFRSATYTATVTSDATTLYRVYGGNSPQIGPYWTRTAPAGPLQSTIDSALNPAWGNTANNVVKIQVPAGTRIFEGVAAPQGGLVGGGNQVFIQNVNPSWIVP